MIIITGANGQLGRAIVENLLTLVPTEQISVSVQNPEKARDLEQRGVRVRRGDFDDAESLAHAFEGASQVLIVSAPRLGEQALRQHRTAIDMAKAAGAQRILYTSQMAANPASPFAPAPDHAATEEALRESGVAFISLRNGYYASSAVPLLGNAIETGEAVAPEDGPVAWTAHDDLARAAAITLTKGELNGITPPLTGTEALDLAGVAEIVSEVTGRPIRRIIVSDDEFRARLIANGSPEAVANMYLGYFAASRQGAFAHVDPTLARLIGRPPMTLRDVVKVTLQMDK
ncbi:NmrA family transcriptional regulator [Dictyobacter sp. S3.2.2.5]|uniref:NmrA family transcriptional regulator n=1 Tax=Dictyobacter halimunensis TaxID=3026934 RepID=A0ABQ6G595_9CHLR|nr:NmrA family transcriptional regulator [Dictyobacter sp. S3.2.2.5]